MVIGMSRDRQRPAKQQGHETSSAAAPDSKGTKSRQGERDVVRSFGWILLVATLALAVVAAAAVLALLWPDLQRDSSGGTDTAAAFVGSETCAGCHRSAAEL